MNPQRLCGLAVRGLPPVLLMTDENDVLRDEGEANAHKLTEAGVQVTAVRYLGTVDCPSNPANKPTSVGFDLDAIAIVNAKNP